MEKGMIKGLLLVQKLLKGMYESDLNNYKNIDDELKRSTDANKMLEKSMELALTQGAMDAVTYVSKFINEIVDNNKERITHKKEEKKNETPERKYMDIKTNVNKQNSKDRKTKIGYVGEIDLDKFDTEEEIFDEICRLFENYINNN